MIGWQATHTNARRPLIDKVSISCLQRGQVFLLKMFNRSPLKFVVIYLNTEPGTFLRHENIATIVLKTAIGENILFDSQIRHECVTVIDQVGKGSRKMQTGGNTDPHFNHRVNETVAAGSLGD